MFLFFFFEDVVLLFGAARSSQPQSSSACSVARDATGSAPGGGVGMLTVAVDTLAVGSLLQASARCIASLAFVRSMTQHVRPFVASSVDEAAPLSGSTRNPLTIPSVCLSIGSDREKLREEGRPYGRVRYDTVRFRREGEGEWTLVACDVVEADGTDARGCGRRQRQPKERKEVEEALGEWGWERVRRRGPSRPLDCGWMGERCFLPMRTFQHVQRHVKPMSHSCPHMYAVQCITRSFLWET